MKLLVNIVLAVLNVSCIIIGNFYDACWSLWTVCTISTLLFIINTITNGRLSNKVDKHEQALMITGDDVE